MEFKPFPQQNKDILYEHWPSLYITQVICELETISMFCFWVLHSVGYEYNDKSWLHKFEISSSEAYPIQPPLL